MKVKVLKVLSFLFQNSSTLRSTMPFSGERASRYSFPQNTVIVLVLPDLHVAGTF